MVSEDSVVADNKGRIIRTLRNTREFGRRLHKQEWFNEKHFRTHAETNTVVFKYFRMS